MRELSHTGKTHFGKGVLKSWPFVRKNFISENGITDNSFHCQNIFHNEQISGGKTPPIENHPSYTFSAILRDNQNCQLEFKTENAPRYDLYPQEQLFSRISELHMQIPAAIDSFFEGCQKILHNITNQASDIVSTFPSVSPT